MASVSADPRFQLARSLLSGQGADGSNGCGDLDAAIEIFASLLEESRNADGETSLNAALCQYEYGNALFRAAVRRTPLDAGEGGDGAQEEEEDKKPAARASNGRREMMAAAALKRSSVAADANPSSMKRAKTEEGANASADKENEGQTCRSEAAGSGAAEPNGGSDGGEGNSEDDDDVALALDMMETSFAILMTHVSEEGGASRGGASQRSRQTWIAEQLPRVLVCIGDLHSFRGNHGNAVESYCRALPLQEKMWDRAREPARSGGGAGAETTTVEGLRHRRHVVETNVLVAEALLECPEGADVVCDGDGDDDGGDGEGTRPAEGGGTAGIGARVLVPAGERLGFARSYYEAAREGLEDILFRMGTMKAAGADLGKEKEDVSYLVMMVVGLGSTLEAKE